MVISAAGPGFWTGKCFGRTARCSLTIATLVLAAAAAAPAKTSRECGKSGDVVSYCGLPKPEDLEVLPAGKGVLASELGIRKGPSGPLPRAGSLKWLDPKTGVVTVLYPSASNAPGKNDWGDPTCSDEIGASLMPHGIHLSQRHDGAWQLLVVNHGARESVEFFELARKDRGWSLRWRGCVIPPSPNRLNDVVGLPDGDLLVTTMHRLEGSAEANLGERVRRGENTGFLWRWSSRKGFAEQPGSASPRPNGVQIDAAGRYAYINTSAGGGEVRKLDLTTGAVVGAVSLSKPDNSSWTSDGRLLVTGMTPEASPAACFATPEAACPAAFNVYALDPQSMRAELLFEHAGPPLGAATVAVQYGSDLLIGSLFGDQVMAVRRVFNDRR